MKSHNLLLSLSLIFIAFIFTSTSPYEPPLYGGRILTKNVSSHNIYIVLRTISDTERMLCIEKNEQISIRHVDSYKDLASPANYYTDISLYDFDSGLLLNKLTVNAGTFKLKSGSVNACSALFEFTIDDDFSGGGL
jgi:hypothetical protein